MAIETPPTIDPAPLPAPQRGDRTTFSSRVDAFVTWLTLAVAQFAAVALNVAANATEAMGFATAAQAARDTAQSYRDAAQAARDTAQGYRDTTLTYRNQAADSAAAAAVSSTAVTATSATSLTLTNGTKVLDVGPGKQFVPNQPISIATALGKMFGTVTSYVSPNLTAEITQVEGTAGTYNSWSIAPSGGTGPTGGTAGGSLTGALNEKKGTAPASSATPDIWGAGGNRVPISSTVAITGLPNAPQAGAKRTAIAEAAFPLVSSANFLVAGGSTSVGIGDEIDFVAETLSTFKVTVRRADGTATVPVGFRNIEILTSSTVWTAKVDGPTRITLVGAGGSGGVARALNLGSAAASGASTGGIVTKTFNAVAGNSYTLTLGAFGASVVMSSGVGNLALSGNDAGDSTFIGNGLSLTAGGGKKGNATASANSTAVALGAVGGTASGGDYNYSGAGSGTATAFYYTPSSFGSGAATGGGASPWKGVGYASGSATTTYQSNAGGALAVSGGAGVGGKSGDATALIGGGTPGASAGGGYLAASPAVNAAPGTVGGAGFASLPGSFIVSTTPLTLGGTGSAASSNSASPGAAQGAGSGGSAYSSSGSAASIVSGSSALLGGTGGSANFGTSGAAAGSGNATFGGASGGVVITSDGNAGMSGQSGNGGAAFAIIETK